MRLDLARVSLGPGTFSPGLEENLQIYQRLEVLGVNPGPQTYYAEKLNHISQP